VQGSATTEQDVAGAGRQAGIDPYCLCLTKVPAK